MSESLANHKHIKQKFFDISYANASKAQKLDIYLPNTGNGPFPLIFFIHGGAFAKCDKGDSQVQPFLMAPALGFAVASVNYRLSGEAIFPAGLNDLRAALRFLKTHAAEYFLNPERIAVAGGSAGGNYAAMICALTGFHEWEEDSHDCNEVSCDVQAGVAWYPPTDFLKMDKQLAESSLFPQDHNDADSPESRYMGGHIIALDVDYVQKANPMTYVHPGMAPMFIQHGRRDHIVPWQQSAMLADKIRLICGTERVQYEILEDADHADPLFETAQNMEKVFSFLQKHI